MKPLTTSPRARLPHLATLALIEQYELAISSYAGRYSEAMPRQRRINYICELLLARAEAGDADAARWLDA